MQGDSARGARAVRRVRRKGDERLMQSYTGDGGSEKEADLNFASQKPWRCCRLSRSYTLTLIPATPILFPSTYFLPAFPSFPPPATPGPLTPLPILACSRPQSGSFSVGKTQVCCFLHHLSSSLLASSLRCNCMRGHVGPICRSVATTDQPLEPTTPTHFSSCRSTINATSYTTIDNGRSAFTAMHDGYQLAGAFAVC